MERGNVVRSPIDQVRQTGRDTAGVIFATPGRNDAIVAVARNPEATEEAEEELAEAVEAAVDAAEVDDVTQVDGVPSEEPPGEVPDGAPHESGTGDDE